MALRFIAISKTMLILSRLFFFCEKHYFKFKTDIALENAMKEVNIILV